MKKFKTNQRKKKIFFPIIIFFIIFTILSFYNLDSHSNLVSFILKNTSFTKEKINFNYLNYLINDYSFHKKITNNKRDYTSIYLYSNDKDIINSFSNNLNKLSIKNKINEKINNEYQYIINIDSNPITNNSLTIDNKKYAKITLFKSNNQEINNLIEKINNYLNKYYEGLSKGIEESNNNDKAIYIKLDKNNYEEINNSTEILALIFYYILGDKL